MIKPNPMTLVRVDTEIIPQPLIIRDNIQSLACPTMRVSFDIQNLRVAGVLVYQRKAVTIIPASSGVHLFLASRVHGQLLT